MKRAMLTLKVDGEPGADIRRDLMPQMYDLAQRAQCNVEMRANDTLFLVRPEHNLIEVLHAYDRLYPKSSVVSAGTDRPVPRA